MKGKNILENTILENIIVDQSICLHIPSISYAAELFNVIDLNR